MITHFPRIKVRIITITITCKYGLHKDPAHNMSQEKQAYKITLLGEHVFFNITFGNQETLHLDGKWAEANYEYCKAQIEELSLSQQLAYRCSLYMNFIELSWNIVDCTLLQTIIFKIYLITKIYVNQNQHILEFLY